MKDVPIGYCRSHVLAKEYANKHTDYHELSCGNSDEQRLHEALVKAYLTGFDVGRVQRRIRTASMRRLG